MMSVPDVHKQASPSHLVETALDTQLDLRLTRVSRLKNKMIAERISTFARTDPLDLPSVH
jgi:hypothetical protein